MTIDYNSYEEGYDDGFTEGYDNKKHDLERKIVSLTLIYELMKGWEKIAHTNGEDKRKYLDIINEALHVLEATPYWDRSGNCEPAIALLKSARG